MRRATLSLPGDLAIPNLQESLRERKDLIDGLAEDRGAITGFENLRAKAFSRAERTRLTCAKYLSDIERDEADAATQAMKGRIEGRFLEAQHHINEVICALGDHRGNIENTEHDVSKREKRLSALDDVIEPAVSGLLERLNAAAAREAESERRFRKEKLEKVKLREAESDEAVEDVVAEAASSTKVESAATANGKSFNKPVIVSPINMAGGPIDETTVGSDKYQSSPDQAGSRPLAQPANPIPLRSATKQPTKALESETTLEDSGTNQPPVKEVQARIPEEVAPPLASLVGLPAAKSEPDQQPCEESSQKVGPDDGDSNSVQPAEQAEPAVAASEKSEHQRWDELIDRILKERVPIKLETLPCGRQKFTVPALGEDDQMTLKIRRFAYRTPVRL